MQGMKESTVMGKRKGKEFWILLMGQNTKANFERTRLKGMAFINGLMEEYSKGIGSKIRCTGEVQ